MIARARVYPHPVVSPLPRSLNRLGQQRSTISLTDEVGREPKIGDFDVFVGLFVQLEISNYGTLLAANERAQIFIPHVRMPLFVRPNQPVRPLIIIAHPLIQKTIEFPLGKCRLQNGKLRVGARFWPQLVGRAHFQVVDLHNGSPMGTNESYAVGSRIASAALSQ